VGADVSDKHCILKMEERCSSETLLLTHKTIQRHTQEEFSKPSRSQSLLRNSFIRVNEHCLQMAGPTLRTDINNFCFCSVTYTMQVTVVALNLFIESYFYCSYCLFNDAACSSGYIRRMVGLLANNELE